LRDVVAASSAALGGAWADALQARLASRLAILPAAVVIAFAEWPAGTRHAAGRRPQAAGRMRPSTASPEPRVPRRAGAFGAKE
jgi:hypothetical protein